MSFTIAPCRGTLQVRGGLTDYFMRGTALEPELIDGEIVWTQPSKDNGTDIVFQITTSGKYSRTGEYVLEIADWGVEGDVITGSEDDDN